ncbi:PIG-X [Bisporella sp. PMI_857]|nr:PIG-X [Bisporella sp. PMI_857]
MRQRITFLQEPQDSIDPQLLKVTKASISTEEIKAAREDRVTFAFDDLPQELYRVLKVSHELHIRWISPNSFDTIAPLVSRLSPGLHLFYTAQRGSNNSQLLCPALKKVFGDLDCLSPEQSFTKLPAERFSQSAAAQYYQPLENLKDFVEYSKYKLCYNNRPACLVRVTSLLDASSVDFDFDTISHALTITAFWAPRIQNLNIEGTSEKDRLEVGVLSVEAPREPEELSLGGFLTVVGEDTKPKPTLFSFPARHHPLQSTFSASFLEPTGLHPTLQIQISSSTPPTEERACSLHAHLSLPRTIFVDKYQLSDPLFLASKNLTAIHHVTTSVDLEAPAYTMDIWGSSVLLELAPPAASSHAWTAAIPLHLRYLLPAFETSGISQIEVPYPVVFWACVADEGSKFPINPFDRVNIGYDGLFGPKTMFYHISPTAGRLFNTISVPVLDLDRSKYVEVGTAGIVLLGFLWVIWTLLRVWNKNGYKGLNTKVDEKKRQ